MKGPLRAEDGAKFSAVIHKTDVGSQASFHVSLDAGGNTFTESDIQLFDADADAEKWLDAQAARRGFTSYPIERK
jgi:hypothetical protein